MAFVQAPVAQDRDPHEVHLIKHDPECPDRAFKDRGKSDIEDVALFFKELAAFLGFSQTLFGKVHVGPAGEPVLFIPGAFSVTNQNKLVHSLLLDNEIKVSMMPARHKSKGRKIFSPGPVRGLKNVLSVKIIRQRLTDAREFFAPRKGGGLTQRQIHQLQGPISRFLEIIGLFLRFKVKGSFDFTARIRHLFGKGKLAPPARHEFSMIDHGLILWAMIPSIFLRSSAFFTPRLRLSCEGRMLIMESYSRKASPSSSG